MGETLGVVETVDTEATANHPEYPERAGAEQSTIHEQAYWDRDAELAARNFETYRGMKPSELSEAQLRQMVGYIWKVLWQDHQLIKALALETQETQAPKSHKRVPKAKKTGDDSGETSEVSTTGIA